MGGTVFVLGAGASFGDTLCFPRDYSGDHSQTPPNPPLTNQFFDAPHLNGTPEEVEKQNAPLFAHIRQHWGITDPPGTEAWNTLSIEDVFSSLAILNDFSPAGTDEKALSQLLLNDLNKYIRRTLSMSTMFRFGTFTRVLSERLAPEDSVINFNYDLLMDQELLLGKAGPLQYQNFSVKFLETDLFDPGEGYDDTRLLLTEPVSAASNNGPSGPTHGLYLKPHGSLNWFTCPNVACPKSRSFVIVGSVIQCLAVSAWRYDFQCNYCHGELTPLLVPPLAQKPVMNNPHLRNIWGNAFAILANAAKVVIVGFSFQPSDFYAAWLFRYALKYRQGVKVVVVNPGNANPNFQARMRSIFGQNYDPTWDNFSQIDEIIATP
jgi:hypothetical protein